MIKYGLISETDGRTIEKTIDLICDDFANQFINVTEIGLYNCETSIGIWRYIGQTKIRHCNYIGIDSEKDKAIVAPGFMNLIIGNSNEVYNQLEDNSQHMIFCDGDHSFIGVISDFFAYADKVKKGGYFCFHDTGAHIKKFKDFQHGDKGNPDSYISVRKALTSIGLIGNPGFQRYPHSYHGRWELIFDEADESDEAGGVTVFRRLY